MRGDTELRPEMFEAVDGNRFPGLNVEFRLIKHPTRSAQVSNTSAFTLIMEHVVKIL